MRKRSKSNRIKGAVDINFYNNYAVVKYNGRKSLKVITPVDRACDPRIVTLKFHPEDNKQYHAYCIHNLHEVIKWVKDADYQTRRNIILYAEGVFEMAGFQEDWAIIKAAAECNDTLLKQLLMSIQ